ncbi:MAG: DUF6328 family protein [Leucobacter sp.]
MSERTEPSEGRNESSDERADRNWTELTQELRVSQTGAQFLMAFLLIVPFQPRFTELVPWQEVLYLVVMASAALANVLIVAPVSLHRILFQRGKKTELVRVSNTLTRAALVALAVAIAGAVSLVFIFVVGGASVWVAPAITLLLTGAIWLWLPWRVRTRSDSRHRNS